MTVKEALKRLRENYPDAKLDVKKAKDYRGYACSMIMKDGEFLAWVKDGKVDTSLIPELESTRK
jgi:hypothetical protein